MDRLKLKKFMSDFIRYLDTLPIEKSPNKDQLQSVIKVLKAVNMLEPSDWSLIGMKGEISSLKQYAKHPTTLKNIQIMIDAIDKVQKQEDMYKVTRRSIYNAIKAREQKLEAELGIANKKLVVLIPADTMLYLTSRLQPILKQIEKTVESRWFMLHEHNKTVYVMLSHLFFDQYHDKDISVLPLVDATVTAYKSGANLRDTLSDNVDKLLGNATSMYIITEDTEELITLPFDMLSAHAYLNMVTDRIKGDKKINYVLAGARSSIDYQYRNEIVHSLRK